MINEPIVIKNKYDEPVCHLLIDDNGEKILEMKSKKKVRIGYDSFIKEINKPR